MRSSDYAATFASVVVLTGVQGIAPAIPEIRDAFGLDDSGASLLTVGYLMAAAVLAAPIAALGDRLGERRVLVTSLLVFGGAGVVVSVATQFALLIAARTVQGAAFGVVMAVTVGLTGMGLGTVSLARAQSVRVIALAAAEVVLPVAAGALLAFASWRFATAMQLIALPAALLCALAIPGRATRSDDHDTKRGLGPALCALRTPFGSAVQVPGFSRFLLKFAVLTYWPLLAADSYGMSPWAIGAVLSVTAVASIVAAWIAPMLIGRRHTAFVTLIGLSLAAVPLVLMGAAPTTVLLTLLVIVSGLGDGLLGVANNVSASMAAPERGRSAFFGLTGSIRNLGKFSALAIIGAATAVAPLGAALALVGVLGLASTGVIPVMARGESQPPPKPNDAAD
ncbi:MFS transporter [Mycolicibacterium iranicum]|uniref:Major facilitator superfamily (MFS) profile domain-containing protein n=1 Tax=Mycolicibacterium iranicum TaxID=912594 RepID=A0A178LUS8_MYCIR|nr:MFS transporter [Mycolicibacterium iranicum]OAN37750.1 hypothetical protein A4X20_21735 [Mycolicibacterium iranicum]